MKKIQIICIFIFIICAGNEVLYAQKTVYEKKVLEIKKKYIKKIMLSKRSWTQKMEAELTYATETEINASFTLAVLSSPNDLQNLKNELKQDVLEKLNDDFLQKVPNLDVEKFRNPNNT